MVQKPQPRSRAGEALPMRSTEYSHHTGLEAMRV